MHKKPGFCITIISATIIWTTFPCLAQVVDDHVNENVIALDLNKILKSIEEERGGGQNTKDKSEGGSEDRSGTTRLERRLKLLVGVGTLLSSADKIDYESERKIGESLALEGFRRYGLPVKNTSLQKYVNLVGIAVARNSPRPGLPYRFVILDNQIQNAFSCPGGIIFLCSGLVKCLKSEAQLACVLAHEVAHVGHKHALQVIERARFFQGLGKITEASIKGEKGRQYESMIHDLQAVVFDTGLDRNREFEADLTAMETAYRTGYRPNGMIEVLKELKKIESVSPKRNSWFSTHPPLTQRIRECVKQLQLFGDWRNLAQLPSRFKGYRKILR